MRGIRAKTLRNVASAIAGSNEKGEIKARILRVYNQVTDSMDERTTFFYPKTSFRRIYQNLKKPQ